MRLAVLCATASRYQRFCRPGEAYGRSGNVRSLAEGDFRVGRVVSRSVSVLSGRFVTLFIVAAAAYLPTLLVSLWLPSAMPTGRLQPGQVPQILAYVTLFLAVFIVFSVLGQAMIVHAAFQDMRRRPVP